MKIICSADVLFACEAFSALGDTSVIDPASISAGDVRKADILVVRSTVRVGPELLEGSSVKFAGTATIGFDHFDIPRMNRLGIKWCYAPGCNANSVAEYVVASLLCLSGRHKFRLAGKTIGIIGVGNVGRIVAEKCAGLGMRILLNDPPRRERENESGTSWSPLDRLLTESDIVSLHVPLTHDGPYATYRMADAKFFGKMKKGAILLNTARGGVVDTGALIKAIGEKKVSRPVIDTWEGEPDFSNDLLKKSDIGTPHIAGHSLDGKVMGTVMIYRQVCAFLGVIPSWSPEHLLPPPSVPELNPGTIVGGDEEDYLRTMVRKVYDVEADDMAMRNHDPRRETRESYFCRLRREYPARREFRFTRVSAEGLSAPLAQKLRALGFSVSPEMRFRSR